MTFWKLWVPNDGVPLREFYMDGLHRLYVVLAQPNDPLTGVLRISAEQYPGTQGISSDGSVFALVLSRQGEKERTLFRSFPVLTTARADALKWRNPRSQGESIDIAKTRKTSHEANR